MDGRTGLSAAINLAVFCENELAMVVLEIGPLSESGAHPALDATLELAGEHLLYSISLKRTGVFLSAAPWMALACWNSLFASMTRRPTGQPCNGWSARWK
jgi:hypothetical protein